MSLLDNNNQELTKEQKKERAVQNLRSNTSVLFMRMIQTYEQGMRTVWNNQQGLTPQEVMDGLGTDAAEAVNLRQLLKQTIQQAKPDQELSQRPEGKDLQINDDGTVTVVDV